MDVNTMQIALKGLGTVPPIFLEYLLGLAAEKPGQVHLFELSVLELGGRELQSIRHESEDGAFEFHKVFGFAPVEGAVTIRG